MKGAKDLYGGYPTEFAGSTQNPKKKYRNAKLTNQNENFNKKSMFLTLKDERSQKFAWWLPNGICKLEPNPKKNYRNTKSTNQNENFPKNSMFNTLKV
jgi:hypothetical protein